MELPVLLAAFGPMRRGEICAFESSDISGNVVHVNKNMVKEEGGGWGNDSTLKAVYRHALADRSKEMNSLANQHFESLCNTKKKNPLF